MVSRCHDLAVRTHPQGEYSVFRSSWIWLVLALDSNVFSSRILRCLPPSRRGVYRNNNWQRPASGQQDLTQAARCTHELPGLRYLLLDFLDILDSDQPPGKYLPLDQGMDPLHEDVCFCLDLFLLKQCFALDPMTWTTYLSRGLLIRH